MCMGGAYPQSQNFVGGCWRILNSRPILAIDLCRETLSEAIKSSLNGPAVSSGMVKWELTRSQRKMEVFWQLSHVAWVLCSSWLSSWFKVNIIHDNIYTEDLTVNMTILEVILFDTYPSVFYIKSSILQGRHHNIQRLFWTDMSLTSNSYNA